MSQSDDFLSRWSRRKQQAAREASLPAKAPDPAAADEKADLAERHPAAAADAVQTEPIFDLTKLPSLDSIGPDTDVRLFMQPGVPAPLTHAALRRAWSADPAIRDFIGLSENSWDFTKPETIAGFGPLLPIDDVKRLLARVLKDDEPIAADQEQTAPQQEDDTPAEQVALSQEPEIERNSSGAQETSVAGPVSLAQCTNIGPDSTGTEPAEDTVPAGPRRRRHGGALPG